MNFNDVFEFAKITLTIAITISLSIAFIMSGLLWGHVLKKRIDLKEANKILEENINIVDEAVFISTNHKFQSIIDEQIEQMKENKLTIATLKSEIADLEKQKNTK